MLTELEEDKITTYLKNLGAKGTLLHELTDHWCVLIGQEKNNITPFNEAFGKIIQSQSAKAKMLIAEINELKFPYFISNKLIKIIGIVSISLLLIGIGLRISRQFPPFGLLLPGYIAVAFIFLPLWFIKKLNSAADKIITTLTFLTLITLVHTIVLWMNRAPSKWISVICLMVSTIFYLWCYFKRRK
jgi:hypothetical protein